MTKKWPVSMPWPPMTVEAPTEMLGYDVLEIAVVIRPVRGLPPQAEAMPLDPPRDLRATYYVTRLEARDAHVWPHIVRQMLEQLTREWFKGTR